MAESAEVCGQHARRTVGSSHASIAARAEGPSVSHDEGSNDAKKSAAEAPSLHDTVPGVPDMELGRTLPTGAAFQPAAAPSAKQASTMPNTPASLPRYDGASPPPQAAHDSARPSAPAPGTGGPLTFGTTRNEFSTPKLSAREKAKRSVLTHTLQMPLVVAPLPPTAANAPDAHRRMTLKGGSQPASAALPAGWTSMHRVGSGVPPEPSSSRPAPRSTVPLHNARSERSVQPERSDPSDGSDQRPRTNHSERFQREPTTDPRRSEPVRAQPTLQDAPPFMWQQPEQSPHELPPWRERARMHEYERETMPDSMPIRIPALSMREWLFIGLLACASAATLYSLLIDDVTRSVEEDAEAAAAVAPEHVVTPAPLPERRETAQANQVKPAAPATPEAAAAAAAAPSAASSANLTEIVSEPAQAEIVVGGAVIGNTPAQVVRGDKDADYLLRKPGYEPQLVRVTPHSPKIITITMHAKQ